MKKLYTIIILAFVSLSVNAQTPDWAWANSAGGTGSDGGNSSITDALGNVYVTGTYSSPSITFGVTTLTNAGSNDVFIVKYDILGNVLWAKSIGGAEDDNGRSVTTDGIGNVYITGYYHSTSIAFGATTLNNIDHYDMFIVKYDALGNEIWATGSGGIGWDEGNSITTDVSGNVFITGTFESSITFGAITLVGDKDMFIVKYDSSGNVLWANRAGSSGYGDHGNSTTTDASGNVYVTGHYFSTSITFGVTTLNNTGLTDIFIVKYDASGNLLWAQSAGGIGWDSGQSISSDFSGAIYISGYFGSSSITLGTTTLTNAGNNDIFMVKYDASGNVIWAKGAGGAGSDYGSSNATDANGNVYVTGNFSSTITFGTTILTNVASNNIFVVKYDSTGNVLWAKGAGSTGGSYGLGITSDASGNLYITGFFAFPSINFGVTTLSNGGNFDMFIAKLDPTIVGIEENKASNEINIYPNPSNGIFNFKDTKNLKQVEVYNLLGEQILAQGNQKQINLSGFSKGIYYARINGELVVKLVKD
jgi:hypothetical protein